MRRSPYNLHMGKRGRWEIRWSEEISPGKPWRSKVKLTPHEDVRDAELWRDTWAREQQGHAGEGVNMTVAEAATVYIEEKARPEGGDVTAGRKLRAPLEALGDRDAGTLTEVDVQEFIADREAGEWGPRAVGGSTIRSELTALQAALNWTLSKHLNVSRPYRFEKPAEGPPRVKWLKDHERARMMDNLADQPADVRIFVRLGLAYGARRGAMLDLRFGDQVRFMERVIDFNVPGATKTKKRRAVVPMTPAIYDELALRMQEIGGGAVLNGMATVEAYMRFAESLQLGWATPHVLKHTCVTHMRRARKSWDDISEITATDPDTLRANYSHFDKDELLAAVVE